MKKPRILLFSGITVLVFSGYLASRADDQYTVAHPECSFFGSQREKFREAALRAAGAKQETHRLSALTEQMTAMMPPAPGGSRTHTSEETHAAGSIDAYIWADFQAKGITPADKTTDWEFIRRVTLDLTGRIPAPDRVLSFVNDQTPGKRGKLIEELLAKPEWVDKWTMYFGDLYQNTTTKASTSLNRFAQGRDAFYKWIHDSLAANTPYNQMATTLITASTDNTYNTGEANWILNEYITGGPAQDLIDQGTSFVFDTFLGITHVNCLLCHNGRGHLDQLSLWGSQTTRYQAWNLASYLSRTKITQVRYDSTNNNLYYWSVTENVAPYNTDYPLNTTTGNRPARVAPAGCKSGQPCYYVPPQYIFNNDAPKPGENYRAALARSVTNDFQFARATVNYIWSQFFGRGIVDPPDTFDPARLDPDNPPPDPWTLQPSNARLLNGLAQHFIDSKYDLKALMREITNSDTYQLSSRYNGKWDPNWEPYFARKLVRRMWAEEIHDAVVQSSGAIPSYTYGGFTDQGFAKPSYAMQFPDTVGGPDGNTNAFLDSFLRGNRDDQPRKSEGSILQALSLMNNNFVVGRVKPTGGTASTLISQNLTKTNTDLINTLFLAILSRYPSSDEMTKAQAAIPASGTTRTTAVQDLVWSLYNKVDFIFNY